MRTYAVLAASLLVAASASAQTVQITGRLVDRMTGLPVEAGNVRVDNGPPNNVGVGGTFRVSLPVGTHSLAVRALGYAPSEMDITVQRDTSIVVLLTARPFALDTVRAESRTVKARTTIRDAASRILLADVEVSSSSGFAKSSGHTGLVTIDVPLGERTHVLFSAFGYVPLVDSLTLQRDTSFTVFMKVDPVATRMIEQQVAKLAERMHGRRAAGKSALTRREVMSGSAPGMFSVLRREGFLQRGRGACIVLDDVYVDGGFKDLQVVLEGILPDRVERVERVYLTRGQMMIRIYTREYVREMMSGRVELRPISPSDCS